VVEPHERRGDDERQRHRHGRELDAGTTAGANTLTATSAGLTGSPVTFTATGTAGAATQIALNAGNAQSATVGTAVATPPSVIVRDAQNNPVSGVSVTFASPRAAAV